VRVILAFDPSWSCTGWALCTDRGPVAAGMIRPGRAQRFEHLARALRELERLDVHRVALEQPGQHAGLYGGADARTVRGIALCAGAVAGWGARWGEPWLLEPHEWRRWWGLGGVARAEGKRRAVALVAAEGWGQHGDDVAEAVLLGVGAARNWSLAR
jgi:hypothetical protein